MYIEKEQFLITEKNNRIVFLMGKENTVGDILNCDDIYFKFFENSVVINYIKDLNLQIVLKGIEKSVLDLLKKKHFVYIIEDTEIDNINDDSFEFGCSESETFHYLVRNYEL